MSTNPPSRGEPSLHDVLQLLAGQITAAVDVTEKAAAGLVAHLDGVDREVIALASERTETTGAAERSVGEVLGGLESYLQQLDASAERNRERMGLLVEDAAALDPIAASIGRIAGQTRYLAINAAIEAGRAGPSGAGFAVVAQEVKSLAQASQQAVHSIGDGLKRLGDRIGKDLAPAFSPERIAAEHAEIQKHLKDLAEISRLQDEKIARMQEGQKRIGTLVVEAIAKMQFQDIVRQQLQAVCAALGDLERVSRAVGTLPDSPARDELRALLDRLNQGYVMDRQRHVHAATVGGTAAAPAPQAKAIELF